MYNILLVDDEKLTLDFLSVSIPRQDADWNISQTCYDGISALDWLAKNDADLIITDIKMPEMDGLTLCQEILKNRPRQKIIILSGYDEFQFAQKAIKFGVKDYLLKPISLPNLKETLNTIKAALSAEQAEEYIYHSLLELNEEGKIQIVSRFIQAIINNSYVETQSLHPMIHRMKINLLDGAGIILLISIDEDILLSNEIPASDIPLYKYILYRLTLELAEEHPANIWISLDHNEDVVVLLSGETYQSASLLAKDFLQEVRKNKFPNMELSLSAGQSSAFEDILMVNDAYQEAAAALNCRIFSRSSQIYIYEETEDILISRIHKINHYVKALHSAIVKDQTADQPLIIDSIIALLPDDALQNRIAVSLYLIKSLKAIQNLWNPDDIMYILSSIPHISTEPEISTRKYLIKVIGLLSDRKYADITFDTDANPEANIVSKAQQYIHMHYAEPVSLAWIAEEIGVSPNYLSTLFHNEMGESYIKYLTGIRMKNAVNYMKNNPNMKIYEIAEKVGYVNVKHFSYVFKQYYSVSPGEYQQKRGWENETN